MEQHGQVRWRRLPHWDLPGATYFVTTCLEGSIPAEGKLRLAELRATFSSWQIAAATGPRMDSWKQLFVESEKWLDGGPAVRFLENRDLARIVMNAFYHWAGQLYDLLAYVVMPSHIHWVFRPLEQVAVGQVPNLPGNATEAGRLETRPTRTGRLKTYPTRSPRERIMHSIKRYTARECNRLLKRMGRFWQEESYDHCVRDDGELERIIYYVENNPVKGGLVESAALWEFSSARDRASLGLLPGQPLTTPAG
jgi:type I restriction enzyme R subunit